MKILFNGLGPQDNITHENKYYKNGAIADFPDEVAKCYIDNGLATTNIEEADPLMKLEQKNYVARKNEASKKKGGAGNGGGN